ncbi:hypothetical protein B0T14DRAFT_495498 [Immersiella caudata]|uniref:Uncharacterized protein n=1 Tax=Immersiella caudata TaxID=314043 RepID=A0AA39WYV9_9PEZI|nr:hypothetical protein B0T14DRAFT_495498 [Immersiella caudata]
MTWRKSFRPLQNVLNGQKRRLMFVKDDGTRMRPIADRLIQRYISDSIITGTDEDEWLEPMRHTATIWRYMHEPEVLADIQNARRHFRQQYRWIASRVQVLRNLLETFDEFDPDYWEAAV